VKLTNNEENIFVIRWALENLPNFQKGKTKNKNRRRQRQSEFFVIQVKI